MIVKFKRLTPTAVVPTRHERAAGWDLHNTDSLPRTLFPFERQAIKTGIALEIPDGYYGQILSRSGLAKEGIIAVGGVIDPDYRGEIIVLLANISDRYKTVNPGDRVAQIVFLPLPHAALIEGELSETKRGAGGFGSSGQ